MDPLSQTIALLRPRGLLWKQFEARGDWAVRFPTLDGAVFCQIISGSCIFQMPGRTPRQFSDGDFFFLTAPPVWTLGTDPALVPTDFTRPDAPSGVHVGTIGAGKSGPTLDLLGGHFRFDDANSALRRSLLPDIVEVPSQAQGAARLKGLLESIGDEATSDRPGRSLVLDRLLELLLVEVIRNAGKHSRSSYPGLLAGLSDRRIATALEALHADIAQSWTVVQLADIAGMSRSTFAECFCRTVGLPPIDYLSQWRMAVAKDMLRRGDRRLADVAFACGYQSASAFSTAFARTVGCPPSLFTSQNQSEDSKATAS
jgi:AraC-like DNA-binding protein